MHQTLLIKSGTIVSAEKTYAADLLVQDGVIAAIGADLSQPEAHQVDARSASW